MKRTLFSLFFCVATATGAYAHPHVWVKSASEIVFDKRGQITGVRHHWRFDEAFSAYAAQGLDTDGDGTYSREELQPLAKVNVESLSEFAFFTFMAMGDYQVGFAAPRDYWLDFDNSALTLHYTLPLARPLVPTGPVTLEVYDPEFFVAFSLPNTEAVRLADAPGECSLSVNPARELDASAATLLAQIGPDQRELPEDLKALTAGTENTAVVTCG